MSVREVHFASTRERPVVLNGDDDIVDQQLELLEQRGGSYRIEETDVIVPEKTGLTPHELQNKRISYAHLGGDTTGMKIAQTLRSIGAYTYADILALGASSLKQHSDRSVDAYYTSQRFGLGALGRIKAATFFETGHRLRTTPATPAQWHDYYEDIGQATIALALPQEDFPFYGALVFDTSERLTVGSLTDAPLPKQFWERYCSPAGPTVETVAHFISTVLPQQVIEPFNATRPSAPQQPQ